MQRGPEWREQINLHQRREETAKLQQPHQLSWVSFSFFSTSLWSIREGRFTPKNWTNATTKWRQLVAKLVTNAQLYFTSPPQNTFGQFLPVGVWTPLSVKTVCPILQEDIYPIMISSNVLKSVLLRMQRNCNDRKTSQKYQGVPVLIFWAKKVFFLGQNPYFWNGISFFCYQHERSPKRQTFFVLVQLKFGRQGGRWGRKTAFLAQKGSENSPPNGHIPENQKMGYMGPKSIFWQRHPNFLSPSWRYTKKAMFLCWTRCTGGNNKATTTKQQ